MYAVIKTGGKQERVREGDEVQVERLGGVGDAVELAPVLIVDGDTVLARPDDLAGCLVRGDIVDEVRGPKVVGFTYKPKSNNRRRWGHRQTYSVVRVTAIERGA